jgi:hypothetical protein
MSTIALTQLLMIVSIFGTQNAAKPITVKPGSQRVVTLAGKVRAAETEGERKEYSYLANVSLINVSGKDISLLVYRIEIGVPIKEQAND